MGEQAKQSVGRQGVAPFEMEHHQHHRGGGGKYTDHQLEVEQDGKRNAKQGRVRNRLAKVGEPPPDDETSRWSGDKCQPDTGEQGACQEIVQHRSVRLRAVVIPGNQRGVASDADPFVMFVGHQDHYVVTRFHRSFKVMRDQQDAAVQIAADLFDQLMEQACSGDIDALGRLLEDQQIGPVNQRPSEQQPLKLAARQGRDRRVAEPFQTDGGKRGVNVMAGKRPVSVIRRRRLKGSVELTGNRCGT